MHRICALCALIALSPSTTFAQQTAEKGFFAIISRDDLKTADGKRHESVGAALWQDRTNVHGDGPTDADDQMDDWFVDAKTRDAIPQMIDLLYVPDMTKRLILLGGTKVFVRVVETSDMPRITSVELAE